MVGDILRRFAIGCPTFGQNRPVGLYWGQVGQFKLLISSLSDNLYLSLFGGKGSLITIIFISKKSFFLFGTINTCFHIQQAGMSWAHTSILYVGGGNSSNCPTWP